MAFRWDLLQPTKTTLQRDRAPTTADATAWYPVVWVYTSANLAWLLKDNTIQVLPPTSGNAVIIPGISSTSFSELEAKVDGLETEVDDISTDLTNVVLSDPGSTEYQITEIALDANKKIIVTHDDTPEA